MNIVEAVSVEAFNKGTFMMFNWQRNLMTLSRFPALCLFAVLGMGICTSMGQTNGPLPQNAPRVAPSNGVRGNNVRPNNSNLPYIPRGPANVSQRPLGTLPPQVQSQPNDLRPNYSPLTRQLNPRLAATRIQQHTPIDIVQPPLSITDDQRAARTD